MNDSGKRASLFSKDEVVHGHQCKSLGTFISSLRSKHCQVLLKMLTILILLHALHGGPLQTRNDSIDCTLLQWEEVVPQPGAKTELLNGAVNPDVLRERLQSHAEASPSNDSFQSTFESPSSRSTGQSR